MIHLSQTDIPTETPSHIVRKTGFVCENMSCPHGGVHDIAYEAQDCTDQGSTLSIPSDHDFSRLEKGGDLYRKNART